MTGHRPWSELREATIARYAQTHNISIEEAEQVFEKAAFEAMKQYDRPWWRLRRWLSR